MGVYGPFNASLNTVVKVTGIDVNADRVFIENQSRFTLAVGFTPTQPPAITTLYGHPWYGEVPPGGKTVPIPRSAYNEQFPGYFWVLALDAISATRALTGTSSGNVAFFVHALLPGESAPADYAIPQSVDAASQARVIHIPISPTYSFSGDHSWAGSDTFRPFPTPLVLSPGGGTLAFPGNVHIYLFAYKFTFIAAASGAMIMLINIEELASDLVTVLATHQLSEFGVSATTPDITPRDFFPAIPKQITFQPNASARGLQLAIQDASAVTVRLAYEILVDVDVFNTGNNSWVTAIGGGATGTPIAAVYGSGGELF